MADADAHRATARRPDKELLTHLADHRASVRTLAERELFERFRAPLERMLRRMLGRDTDDALQEVFLDVFRGLSSFRGHARLSTWIYRVALRRAWKIAATRRRQAMPAQPERGANPLPTSAADVGGELAAQELARRFERALDQLDLDQRTVMALSAIEGLGSKEIAAVLGVPVGTVHSRLHRARERVQVLLGIAL